MAARAAAPKLKEHYVLCLDDEVDFLKSLELFLPDQVNADPNADVIYHFLFCSTPRDALETLSSVMDAGELVAMIITDQKMPEMKGTEFLEEARKKSPASVRVLLTGHAGLESAISAINSNLLDKYLMKPIENEQDFTVSIRHLLATFQMRRRIEQQTRALGDLYQFSVAVNASETLAGAVNQIGVFAQKLLDCRDITLLVNGEGGWETVLPLPSRPALIPRTERLEAITPGQAARLVWDSEESLVDLPSPSLEVPVFSGKICVGFLAAAGFAAGAVPDDQLLASVNTLAETAGIAIQNQVNRARLARAFEETRAQASALAAANSRLELLDRLKNDFLSFISHELRTPLSCISAVDLLDRMQEMEKQATLIEAIRNGYDRLQGFVEKGLEYFDWMAQNEEVASDIDLSPLVVETAQRVLADSKRQLKLTLNVPREPSLSAFPRAAAFKVVETLVSNAVKFTPEIGAELTVSLRAEGDLWVLQVTDNGCGFPPELATEIFRPFTIANSMNHGCGSALSLAKAYVILQTYGGRIMAESPGQKQGSTFTAYFPSARGVEHANSRAA